MYIFDSTLNFKLVFQDPACTGEQLTEAVKLLQQLGVSTDSLCISYLGHEAFHLTKPLRELEEQVKIIENPETNQVEFIKSHVKLTSKIFVILFSVSEPNLHRLRKKF